MRYHRALFGTAIPIAVLAVFFLSNPQPAHATEIGVVDCAGIRFLGAVETSGPGTSRDEVCDKIRSDSPWGNNGPTWIPGPSGPDDPKADCEARGWTWVESTHRCIFPCGRGGITCINVAGGPLDAVRLDFKGSKLLVFGKKGSVKPNQKIYTAVIVPQFGGPECSSSNYPGTKSNDKTK